MEHHLSPSAAKLLQDLQSKKAHVRKIAADKLGELRASDSHIIGALKVVAETDSNKDVQYSAGKALRDIGVEQPPGSSQHRAPNTELPEVGTTTSTGSNQLQSLSTQLTEIDLLEKLVVLQEKQTATLIAIRTHTGCLYAWLWVSVFFAALYVLILFLNSPGP